MQLRIAKKIVNIINDIYNKIFNKKNFCSLLKKIGNYTISVFCLNKQSIIYLQYSFSLSLSFFLFFFLSIDSRTHIANTKDTG